MSTQGRPRLPIRDARLDAGDLDRLRRLVWSMGKTKVAKMLGVSVMAVEDLCTGGGVTELARDRVREKLGVTT